MMQKQTYEEFGVMDIEMRQYENLCHAWGVGPHLLSSIKKYAESRGGENNAWFLVFHEAAVQKYGPLISDEGEQKLKTLAEAFKNNETVDI